MALINCQSCGQTISDKATKCPYCGMELKTKEQTTVSRKSSNKKLIGIIALISIVLAGIVGWLYYKNLQEKRTAEVTELENLLTQGQKYYDNEDYEAAFQAFHEYRTKADSLNIDNKNMGEVAYSEGCAAYSIYQYKDAYAAFNEALRLGNKNNDIQGLKEDCVTEIVNQADDYAEANNFVSKLLEEEPNNYTFNLCQAIALDRLGEFDNALKYYKKGIELNPKSPKGYQLLGMSLSLKAASDYENGSISIAKERYTQALQNFQKAMELLKNGNDPSLSSTSAGIIQLFINSIESRLSSI